jgi:hypothetical protein
MTRDNEKERTESYSAGKEHERPKNEHECPVSENERHESAHDRNAPLTR